MTPLSREQLHKVRDSVALAGRLSDSLVKIGPFRLGLDGILSWAPGLGELYSIAAGGFIVVQGWRAGVPMPTLGAAAVLLTLRTVLSAAPLIGAPLSDLFTAHRWASWLIVRAIDERLGQPYASPPAPVWASRAAA
jgi:hypothetical protein